MKNLDRVLALILALMFILTSCGQHTDPPEQTTVTTEDPGVLPTPTDRFVILVDRDMLSFDAVIDATNYLKSAIKSVYGIEAELLNDSAFEPDSETYTVLVGKTKYDARGGLPADLRLNDYAWRISEPRLIAVDGGTSSLLLTAVKSFCSAVLGYTDGQFGEAPHIKLGSELIWRSEYSDKAVKVNGYDIEDLTVAVRYDRYLPDAERLVEKLGGYNGYRIPIVSCSELSGNEPAVVCLGALDRAGAKLQSAYDGYRVSITTKNGYTAGIAGGGDAEYMAAFERFMNEINSADTANSISITLPKKTFFDYEYEFTEGLARPWTLDESKTVTESVANGITYKELYYSDNGGAPHIANVLYIDTELYTMSLGMPKSGVTYQTLTGQMENAVSRGLDVVCGVNGDRWNGSAKLRGLTIQNGELITRGTHNGPYFALTKSGKLVFGYSSHSDDIEDLQMSVGADYLLVNKGVPQHYSDFSTNDHLYTGHPRTFVGMTEDGILLLVTVDGRQSHSKGATMENAAELMASLGCYMAVSLDGGGSTTMAVKTANGFEVKNSPSDANGPRTVRNSVLIVKK